MPNPQDTGTFERWITDRIFFQDVPPRRGDTGDFEKWLWNREYWEDYLETPLVLAVTAWYSGPTTPSMEETLGLSISYADPLVKSPRTAYLDELHAEVNSYEHETVAVAGYYSARFDLSGDLVDVNDWFERGIGRHVEVTNPDLETIWEGFVNSVAVNAGQYAATRGPLVEIANRSYAVYSERDNTVTPPTVIPGLITVIAQDATSQGKYGIWEKRITAGETDAVGAGLVRDSFLREHKEPTTDDPRIVFEAGGQVSVSVECLGYWAWMLAYPYQDATSGTVTLQTKVQYVLAGDTNNIFSTDYSQVDYNAALASRYENSGTPAWEVMKSLSAFGDGADNRWTFGIYAGRVAHYKQIPNEVAYQHRLADPDQRIETVVGGEVAPWDVQPARWLYLPDFLTGRGQPVTVADWRTDPRFMFVEAVRYRAPYTVEITGTRVGKLAQILARQGVGSTGG